MADITELYRQRQALDEQIQNAINEAKEGGEVITVDGRDFSSFLDFEGKLQSGKLSDLVPLYRKDADGDIDLNYTGELSIEEIVELFGAEAATLLQQAIEAGETSVEDISNAKTDALAAIGESDSSGARGNAISSINAARSSALGAIGESDTAGARGSAISAINTHVENISKPAINQYVEDTTKPTIVKYVDTITKPSIDSYVNSTSKPALDTHTAAKKAELDSYVTSTSKPALDSYTTEKKGEIDTETTAKLNEALAAIGKTDSEGARGEALTALSTALTNALDAIGRTNDEGARKAAVDAITAALNSALSQIGQTDGEGARKAALDAISAALTSAKSEISTAQTSGVDAVGTAKDSALSALDQKIASANSTIDGKVAEATEQATAASGSASAAASSASAAAGSASAAKTSEDNAKLSESGAAASASGAAISASNAATSETNASNSASAAKASETNAASSASAASGSATAAKTSETNAKTSETNAATSASTASTKATEAAASASQAAESAREAANAANSPLATEAAAGRVRITTNPDYAKPSGVTDPVAASIESLQSVRTAVNTALSKIKVMTSEQLNAAIQKAIDEYKAQAQTQGIDLNDTAFLNGGGVTILVSRILELLAQETGDKVTADAMDAAIQEAVKDIPYPTDEEETINVSHEFTGDVDTNETYDYTLGGTIHFRAFKRLRFNVTIIFKQKRVASGSISFRFKLPAGGKYVRFSSGLSGGYDFYSGEEIISVIEESKRDSTLGAFDTRTVTKEYTYSFYLARLS